jgi:hypothetical protein
MKQGEPMLRAIASLGDAPSCVVGRQGSRASRLRRCRFSGFFHSLHMGQYSSPQVSQYDVRMAVEKRTSELFFKRLNSVSQRRLSYAAT